MIRPVLLCISGLILMFMTSCFKEDEQVTPHARGKVMTDTIALTENYRYQVWFSLDSGEVSATVEKTVCDLGFDCSAGGGQVILNTANFMKVADLGVVPFGLPYDTIGRTMRFDKSDGNPDSTAFGGWFIIEGLDTLSRHHVYAVSRGLDELGNPLGLYQLIFDSLTGGTYYFRYAPLSGGAAVPVSVKKNPAVNFTWYSLALGTQIQVEPLKEQFDLVFGQYTTMLYTDLGQPYPYLVTGVLLNRAGVTAAVDSVHGFMAITRDIARSLPLSGALDGIGYDWKYYDFNTGLYSIRPGISYVVRTVSGNYFKLRFTAFYNRNGMKGYPVIEYQPL